MTGDDQESWMQAQEEHERSLDGRGALRLVGLLVGGLVTVGIIVGTLVLTALVG